jgi:hypothetical protein
MTLGTNHSIGGDDLVEAFEEENKGDTKSVGVYSFAIVLFEVLTGKVPFKDIPLRNVLQSICGRVRLGFTRCGRCTGNLYALIEKCWSTNAVEHPQFPIIFQLFVEYKVTVFKH